MRYSLHILLIATTIITFVACGDDGPSERDPMISAIQPESGPPGTSVTISGSDFSPTASENTVTFDGVTASVSEATESELETEVPDSAESGAVEVTVDGNTASGPYFTVESEAPGISSIEPDSGTVGTEVTINGMNFSAMASQNTITFAGTDAPVNSATENELLTEVPQGATDGPVEVTVDGETATGPDFDVITDGTLRAVISTSGSDKDGDGYNLTVDMNNSVSTGTSDTVYVSDLEEGSHDVELSDVASNCTVSGNNPRSISITAGDTTSTTFDVNCQAAAKNQIAYEHNNEIYLMNADGSNKRQLTDNNYVDDYPVISHDGTLIAFACDRNGNYNICVMEADGTNLGILTSSGSGTNSEPAWSPDNSHIIFQSTRDGDYDLYIMNVQSGSIKQLTDNPGADTQPSWSPDGSKIAYISRRNGDPNVYTVNTDGTNEQQITNTTDSEDSPRWSPDGSELVFSSNRDGAEDLYVINADGTGLQRITNNSGRSVSAGWSPDGSELVYQSDQDGTRKIYKVNADGSGLTTDLTPNQGGEQPHWSPLE